MLYWCLFPTPHKNMEDEMANNFDENPQLKAAVDFDVVGENIFDIADFAIAKFEFRHDVKLSPETKEEAAKQIRSALWELVKEFKARRKQILQRLFETADRVMQETADGS